MWVIKHRTAVRPHRSWPLTGHRVVGFGGRLGGPYLYLTGPPGYPIKHGPDLGERQRDVGDADFVAVFVKKFVSESGGSGFATSADGDFHDQADGEWIVHFGAA
jgi:hypothetical protein